MMGTRTPNLSSVSTIFGTAAAAGSVLTVTRTSSDPAAASAITWLTVDITSAVSVFVIDCTTIGLPPPTYTLPILTGADQRRFIAGIRSILTCAALPLIRSALHFGDPTLLTRHIGPYGFSYRQPID